MEEREGNALTSTASDDDESSRDLSRNVIPDNSFAGGFSDGVGRSNGAKYKLVSPAKLPISRSSCLTIPPGLSPTSFLESPVLLSNMKAEPSPTTGSFINPHMMHTLPITSCSNTSMFDERNSSSFVFKPHNGSNCYSGLPSVRSMNSRLRIRFEAVDVIEDGSPDVG